MTFDSKIYWENRYKTNGNSGLGSYGNESIFKSDFINNVIEEYNIKSINDFGCGDCNQVNLIKKIENYTGYDVSKTVLNKCKYKFSSKPNLNFVEDIKEMKSSDMSCSFDVIYHIVEDIYFEEYMSNLFNFSKKYVLIYSTNENRNRKSNHIKHRKFTEWVSKNYTEFKIIKEKKYPNKDNGVSFFLFEKK
jgi:SAM-dependent methyltransferase